MRYAAQVVPADVIGRPATAVHLLKNHGGRIGVASQIQALGDADGRTVTLISAAQIIPSEDVTRAVRNGHLDPVAHVGQSVQIVVRKGLYYAVQHIAALREVTALS